MAKVEYIILRTLFTAFGALIGYMGGELASKGDTRVSTIAAITGAVMIHDFLPQEK